MDESMGSVPAAVPWSGQQPVLHAQQVLRNIDAVRPMNLIAVLLGKIMYL